MSLWGGVVEGNATKKRKGGEAAIEEAEWREEERQFLLAQAEAQLREGSTAFADQLDDLAAAGLDP